MVRTRTGWCSSPEGQAVLRDIRATEAVREAHVKQLVKGFKQLGVPTWAFAIPVTYGKIGTQLMFS